MKREKASEIFGRVDPHLRVINGGIRYKRRSNQEDWEKAGGVHCSECQQETARLVDGLCPQCWGDMEAERAKKAEDRAERRYYQDQLRKGTISLAQMREGRL